MRLKWHFINDAQASQSRRQHLTYQTWKLNYNLTLYITRFLLIYSTQQQIHKKSKWRKIDLNALRIPLKQHTQLDHERPCNEVWVHMERDGTEHALWMVITSCVAHKPNLTLGWRNWIACLLIYDTAGKEMITLWNKYLRWLSDGKDLSLDTGRNTECSRLLQYLFSIILSKLNFSHVSINLTVCHRIKTVFLSNLQTWSTGMRSNNIH